MSLDDRIAAGRTSPAADGPGRPPTARVVLAGLIGSVMEFFDFAVYGYLAVTLGHVFFAKSDPTASLLASLSVFAAAFVARPVGSIVFGHLGDRVGRRSALALSLLLMCGATAVIGVLPGYAAIGVGAPVLLLAMRCIQGLSAGGELGGAGAYVAEFSEPHRRGYLCSYIQIGIYSGTLLASAVVGAVHLALTPEQVDSFGWRIPFLVAIPIGYVGIYLRRRLADSPEMERLRADGAREKTPVGTLLREHTPAVVRVLLLNALIFVGFYFVFVYVPLFEKLQAHRSERFATVTTVIALVTCIAAMPLLGKLTDAIGRRACYVTACAATLVLTFPAFLVFLHGPDMLAVLTHVVLALAISLSLAPSLSTFAEQFPTSVRYSGIALPSNIAAALMGGTSPYVCTWLIDVTGDPLSPAFVLTAAALLTLAAAVTLRRTASVPLPA